MGQGGKGHRCMCCVQGGVYAFMVWCVYVSVCMCMHRCCVANVSIHGTVMCVYECVLALATIAKYH